MKEIKTEITIHSTPEKVWEVLTDFKRYPEWNPFITSISGNQAVGEHLIVTIHPPEGNLLKFKPLIVMYEDHKEFRWKGKLFIKGLFDGEHYFMLTDNHDGTTTFIHGEKFSGLFVGLLGKALEKTH